MSDYYNLPKNQRWLAENSPDQIGGVSIKFSFVVDCLANMLEHRFYGQLPPALGRQLEALQQQVATAENAVQAFIMFVAEQL